MGILKTQFGSARVLIDWKECGNAREARVLVKADSRGTKTLIAETRPEDVYDSTPRPAEVDLQIPNLAHDALRRNRGDSRLRLTTSPSLNKLTIGLRAPEDCQNDNSYSGEWEASAPHGAGWMSHGKTQRQYIGQFQDGWFTGPDNRIEYRDGTWYEGGVEGANPEGKGTLHGRDNYVYEGHWSKGYRHGKGREVLPDGSGYDGLWENDQRHGKGRSWSSKGELYYGEWSRGQTSGVAAVLTEDGHCYKIRNGKVVA